MIKVIITGPPSGTGFIPYRVDWWAAGRPQFVGVSKLPLLDACRQLQQYGLMDDTVVGLFYEDEDLQWLERTTVGYGARIVRRAAQDRFKSEGGGIAPDQENEPTAAAALDAGIPTDVRPARSAAPPPRLSTPREPLADTGPGFGGRATSTKPHRKRQRAGSSGRQGSRSGR